MAEQITLYKLMILYMLEHVDFSLSYTHISDFILERGYTDYFHLQPAIAELAEMGLIHEESIRSSSYYMITPEGEETIGYFRNRIPAEFRSEMDEWLKENRLTMINDIAVLADYYRCTGGDYEVCCRIREKKQQLCELHLTVGDEAMAKAVCSSWKKKSQDLYQYLMNELLEEPDGD